MNRFLRVFAGGLLAAALLAGCAFSGLFGRKQHTATYLDLFDTVTTLVGYAPVEADFLEEAGIVYDTLRYYHQLFDIYRDYPGINNLKTVNDLAGVSAVEVDPAIIRLLQDCRHYCEITEGRVDVTMGSVLQLWHEARSEGLSDPATARLPDPEALKEAAAHTGFDRIVIDEEAGTVFITDPETSLDVGAIAKGWAVEQAAQSAPGGDSHQRGRQCLCHRSETRWCCLGHRHPTPGGRRELSAHGFPHPGYCRHQRGLPENLHCGRKSLPPHHRPRYRDASGALAQRDCGGY